MVSIWNKKRTKLKWKNYKTIKRQPMLVDHHGCCAIMASWRWSLLGRHHAPMSWLAQPQIGPSRRVLPSHAAFRRLPRAIEEPPLPAMPTPPTMIKRVAEETLTEAGAGGGEWVWWQRANVPMSPLWGLVYFSRISTSRKFGDERGFDVHPIPYYPLKYSSQKIH